MINLNYPHPGNYDLKRIKGNLYRVRRSPVETIKRKKRLPRKYWTVPIYGLKLFCDSKSV